ncbi:MAG: ParB N-terminal domain-containing protein [bacterium]|nr:ParB N-terminal domain-containing protein [bacterium]
MKKLDSIEFHPIAEMFPMMSDGDIAKLATRIKTNGLRHPIVLFEGKILDGRNRYLACQRAGVEPSWAQWEHSHRDAIEFAWDENEPRRHLNPGQKAVAARKRELLLESVRQKAEEVRQEAKGRKGGRPQKNKNLPKRKKEKPSQRIDEVSDANTRRSDAQLARAAGTNRTYYEQAGQLVKDAPVLAEEVLAGKKTLPQAMREVSPLTKKQHAYFERAKRKGTVTQVCSIEPPVNRIGVQRARAILKKKSVYRALIGGKITFNEAARKAWAGDTSPRAIKLAMNGLRKLLLDAWDSRGEIVNVELGTELAVLAGDIRNILNNNRPHRF